MAKANFLIIFGLYFFEDSAYIDVIRCELAN